MLFKKPVQGAMQIVSALFACGFNAAVRRRLL